VQAQATARLEWRDASAYAPLLEADRSLFAWEWLRRDRRYRIAAGQALADCPPSDAMSPEQFGLVVFEHPDLAVPDARPVWSAAACRYVLHAEVAPAAAPDDSFALNSVRSLARVVDTDAAAHLLLSDGLRTIRVDAPPGAFGGAPLRLRYRLEGIISAEPAVLALRRFLMLCHSGHFSRSLHCREPRARRWILMLRTHDALAAGAAQRDVAGELLSRTACRARWRTREPSIRSQVQRLVRAAACCSGGGYRELLR
jgi:hypothetical protein